MKRSFYTYKFGLIVLSFIISCRSKNVHPLNDHTTPGAQLIQKPGSSYKDSLFVLFPAAVFFSPDSMQLSAISKVTDPVVFEGSMHEYYYQMRNARQYLGEHWKNITIMEADKFRYLVFRKADGGISIIDLDKQDACGLFAFDRIREPLLIDMTNVDTQVSDYFSLQQSVKAE